MVQGRTVMPGRETDMNAREGNGPAGGRKKTGARHEAEGPGNRPQGHQGG